jgi:hypothetical protein
MTNLSELDARSVLSEGNLPEYEKGMHFFCVQLFQLNTTIYIVDQILEFPLGLFVAPDKAIFFHMVVRNFFDAGLLVITRLATDQGNDLYTLMRFKKRVRELVRPGLVDLFDERLRECRFDTRTTAMLKKARLLRTERVAHVQQDVVLGLSQGARLSFSELKSLRDALNSLLDALSFNVDNMMLPILYDPRGQHPVGSNDKPDIEELLDSVALKSVLLNLPEERPANWKHSRARLTEAEISQINHYRRKFGLPEA